MLSTITWRKIGANQTNLRQGNSIVINGNIYCVSSNDTVSCYDPSQDNWTTLPPLPVMWFGLGQVNGKLVAVGGRKKVNIEIITNEVYTYDERWKKWKQTIPPMPTARDSPGVLSLQSALVVAGGAPTHQSKGFVQRVVSIFHHRYTSVVEIFKADTSQWYTTDPLPTACEDISLVAIGNTCYALGGYKAPSHLNQALHASVDDLLHNAVPANQATDNTSHRLCKSPALAWKTMTDTLTDAPITAVLGRNLIAISDEKIHMYVPSSESWNCICELPDTNRSRVAAINVSPQEILLFAVNGVYKGTLKYLTV